MSMLMNFIIASITPAHRVGGKAVIGGRERRGFSGKGRVVIGGGRDAGIDLELVKLHIQFFCNHNGLDRICALPTVSTWRDQGDAGCVDFNVWRQGGFAVRQAVQQWIYGRFFVGVVAECDAANDGSRAD